MSQAAYSKKVEVKDDGDSAGTYVEAPATSASLSEGGDVLDDTEMSLSHAFRTRIYGLRDWSVSMTMELVQGTDTAFKTLRDAWLNQTKVTVRYLPDGTTNNGFEGTAVVESFDLSGDVAGKETVEVSLQADGQLSAA